MNPDTPSEFEIALETTPAPVPDVPLEIELIETLRDTGATIPDVSAACAVIQRAFDEVGDHRAADALRIVLSRLKGKKGEEIKIALLGTMGKSLQECADKLGITKQTLLTNIQRLRRRIFGKTSDGATPIES